MFGRINCKLGRNHVIFLVLFGIFFVCTGAYFGFKVVPEVIGNKIWEMKVLKNDTEQWEMFLKIPFPFTFKVYIFDVQNPEDIMDGAMPIVKERGPYVYKLYRFNSDVNWITEERISFFTNRKFYFDQEASGKLHEDDNITILNTVYLNVLYKIEETQPGVMGMIAPALPSIFGKIDGLFVKVRVKDYLFEGLKFCENAGTEGGFVANMACKQIIAQASLSPTMRVQENSVYFANLRHKNTTHTGRFTVDSGVVTKEQTGMLKLYKEKQYIFSWEEKSSCNKVQGLTTVFPVGIKTDMVFESFSDDICRTMSLEYQREETVKGVEGLRFVARNTSFDYGKKENSCFCLNQTRTLKGGTGCPKNGIMDMSTCAGGPIFLSFPHLLHADREYMQTVDGPGPNGTEHETYVTLEPTSGFPLALAQRVQFNMFLRPIEGFELMANVTESLVPLFWVEESTILDDKFVEMIKSKLLRTLQIVHITRWAVVAIGASCILLALFLLVYIQEV